MSRGSICICLLNGPSREYLDADDCGDPLYSLHLNPQVEILLNGVQDCREVLCRGITSTAEHPMEALLVEAGLLRERLERDVSVNQIPEYRKCGFSVSLPRTRKWPPKTARR